MSDLASFTFCRLHLTLLNKTGPTSAAVRKFFFDMISSLQLEEKPKNLGKADDDLKISSHSNSTLTLPS